MKRTMKVVGIVVISFSLFVGILLVASSRYFYNVAVKRSTKDFLHGNKDLAHGTSGSKEEALEANAPIDGDKVNYEAWLGKQDYDTWEITSEDGLKLKGYYIPAKNPTTKTAILVHGYSSQAKGMGDIGQMYYENMGYNIFMADARGHGASEGDYIGFGWPERKDYLLWIDQVVEEVGKEAQIVLHGVSMGGATVMMISGEKLPHQVKTIVEDCGYTSAFEELEYQLKRMYQLPAFPILPATSLYTGWKAGYDFYEASALSQVKKNRLPMLFIHGGEDMFVPTEMVNTLYDACSTKKDLYIVEGAGHAMAYSADPVAYEDKVSGFIGPFMEE